jgi:hypothetical protein
MESFDNRFTSQVDFKDQIEFHSKKFKRRS